LKLYRGKMRGGISYSPDTAQSFGNYRWRDGSQDALEQCAELGNQPTKASSQTCSRYLIVRLFRVTSVRDAGRWPLQFRRNWLTSSRCPKRRTFVDSIASPDSLELVQGPEEHSMRLWRNTLSSQRGGNVCDSYSVCRDQDAPMTEMKFSIGSLNEWRKPSGKREWTSKYPDPSCIVFHDRYLWSGRHSSRCRMERFGSSIVLG